VPPSNKHRLEYEQRVNRVLDHIGTHLGDELPLEALAAIAAFSPFHFHRVFKSMTGENVKEYIQRIRLEAAARDLVLRPHADVIEIALEHGFGSASAFARAFKERFGMSASAWRSGGAPHLSKYGQLQSKLGKATPASSAHDRSMERINVQVKTLPAHHVAYMRYTGPYGQGGIQELWQRMARWASARDLWTADHISLGISHDDPKVTEPAKCRYDAAIEIPRDFRPDGDVNVTDVEGGKYAILPFFGKPETIGEAYDQLFGVWLPGSGYQPDSRPIFELYRGEHCDPETGNFRCDICLPVRPL
jgi:AraC family transcriptional regulator